MTGTDVFSTLDQWGFVTGRLMLSVLWQSTLLFVGAAVLSLALRNQRAAIRCTIWLSALLLAPFLPLLTSLAGNMGAPQTPITLMPSHNEPALAPEPFTHESPSTPANEPTPTEIQPAPAPGIAPPLHPIRYPWALALLAYGLGLTAFLGAFVLGHVRIRRWIVNALPSLDERVQSVFVSARERVHAAKRILLLNSDHVSAPMTVGVVRPVVLLPTGLADRVTEDELRAALIHESAHAARREPLILSTVALVRALLFFHPLAWYAARQVAVLAEHAADECVLSAEVEPVSYAKLLTRMAEQVSRRTRPAEFAAGIVLSRSVFLRRIEEILVSDQKRFRRLSVYTLLAIVLAGAATLSAALALPLKERREPVTRLAELQQVTPPYSTRPVVTPEEPGKQATRFRGALEFDKQIGVDLVCPAPTVNHVEFRRVENDLHCLVNVSGTSSASFGSNPEFVIQVRTLPKGSRAAFALKTNLIVSRNVLIVPFKHEEELNLGPMALSAGSEEFEITIELLSKPAPSPPTGDASASTASPKPSVAAASTAFVVFGTVRDDKGAPIAGAEVSANCGFGTLRRTGLTTSGPDGVYELSFAPGLSVRRNSGVLQCATICASKKGYYELNLCREGNLSMGDEKPATDDEWTRDSQGLVLPNQPFRVDFVMVPGCTVTGILVDAEDKPVLTDQLVITGPELFPSRSALDVAKTDDNGRFTFEDVPCKTFWFRFKGVESEPVRFVTPGHYEVTLAQAEKDGKEMLDRRVTAVPERTTLAAVTSPLPPTYARASEGATVLSYVDDSAEGKRSLGASGHAVQFVRPETGRYIEAIDIFAARYGEAEAPKEDFHLYILNGDRQVLADVPQPYSQIERGDLRWYILQTPAIEVPDQFYVALAFNPGQTKGIYLGSDENVEKSHSFVGLPDEGFEPVGKRYDWMVRTRLVAQPSPGRETKRLADWTPPAKAPDPFAACIEAKYDDGESDNMQSYGGRGPATRFDVAEFLPKATVTLWPRNLQVRGVRLFASRYGSGFDPATTTIKLTILDPAGKVLVEQRFPYSLFSYKEKWVDLALEKPVDLVTGTESFTVAIDPEATQYKGIYFHYNKEPAKSHSLAGTVEKGFTETPDREWMIRAYLDSGV